MVWFCLLLLIPPYPTNKEEQGCGSRKKEGIGWEWVGEVLVLVAWRRERGKGIGRNDIEYSAYISANNSWISHWATYAGDILWFYLWSQQCRWRGVQRQCCSYYYRPVLLVFGEGCDVTASIGARPQRDLRQLQYVLSGSPCIYACGAHWLLRQILRRLRTVPSSSPRDTVQSDDINTHLSSVYRPYSVAIHRSTVAWLACWMRDAGCRCWGKATICMSST